MAQDKSESSESLIRLMKGASVQLIEKNGEQYRKAVDATFLHNGTYLICDTALWNVQREVIFAEGHVKIMQEETVLTSEWLEYSIPENLAKFRGGVVQLQDKQKNTLRTRHLDYNTKDSTAIFAEGAAMRDKDGQIIESLDGTYETKYKKFTFWNSVNMFTDSVFVKTAKLTYESDKSLAVFHEFVDFWKGGDMLSSLSGWYNKKTETFYLWDSVHGTTKEQEAWADKLYYYRKTNDINLLSNAQIQDTTRNVFALADYIYYTDNLSQVEMREKAAVAIRTKDEKTSKVDTLFIGADTIFYRTFRRCDVDSMAVVDAKTRHDEILTDPVTLYRRKAAEEAAQKAADAAANDPNRQGKLAAMGKNKSEGNDGKKNQDSSEEAPEVPETPAEDSLAAPPVPDSSKVGFLFALRNVKAYRKDIQLKCDSLRYNDLDSIARFYKEPVIWNDSVRQYSADSVYILVNKSGMDRASLMSNAFVVTKEDSTHFDQIKGTEILAFFDTTSALKRFDALGGSNAIFFLQEKNAIATANLVECKMMSGEFKNGELDRVFYFEAPKSDAFPVAQLRSSDQRLKGFSWQEELKPRSKYDITELRIKPSERNRYARREMANFVQTNIYFPGYMQTIYREIARRDSLRALSPAPKESGATPAASLVPGSVAAVSDSLGVNADSVAVVPPADSLSASRDSLSSQMDTVAKAAPTEKELRQAERDRKKAEREEKARARQEAKEKRWAEKDARDAAILEAKKQKKQEQQREFKKKQILRQREADARDQALLEKYKAKYEKEKARKVKK